MQFLLEIQLDINTFEVSDLLRSIGVITEPAILENSISSTTLATII